MPNPEEVPSRYRHLPGQLVTVTGWYMVITDRYTMESQWYGTLAEMPGFFIRERCLVLPPKTT